MEEIIEIKPHEGLSGLRFGSVMDDAEKIWGKPEETENLESESGEKSVVWHYWQKGISLFFEANSGVFNCVEIDNEEAVLWGEKIFEINEEEIVELFHKKGIEVSETEDHDWGEKRISFDVLLMDLYFENDLLISVSYCGQHPENEILILPN